MQSKRLRVLVTSTAASPFIRDDVEILRRHFDVDFYIGSGIPALFANLRRAFRADVTLCWFGSVYAFFAVLGSRLAGRESMIILGGVDVAREPEIGYGIWRSRWKSALLTAALRWTGRIYAVDLSLRDTLESSSGRPWPSILPLPTGYDPALWNPPGPKEDLVLLVAGCDTMQRARIKGVDLLIAAASRLPGRRFLIVGLKPELIDLLRPGAPANVGFLPPTPRRDLPALYGRARIFCQPSRREGLPNALCEAMLCRCIPVGTDVGGIPTAIGDAGFIVEPENPEALADAIERGFAAPEQLGDAARARIAANFTLTLREVRLVNAITELADA
ncbi:MAG: glycosyl transferase, group 1 family protein [Chlorobi bacterium]|nr:glycosyl transferase, group 1 family protein [Chlorobiota bacterium]